jgi:hypothetical protein
MQMDCRSEFSHFCKLLDSPLCRNLSDDKFEMIALLAFNRQSIQEFDENDNPLSIKGNSSLFIPWHQQ